MFKKLLLSLIVLFTVSSLFAQNCSEVFIEINMDNFPQEASWEIFDDSQNVVAVSSEMVYGMNTSVVCLEDGCFSMVMSDTFGDGWDLSNSDGSVVVSTATTVFETFFVTGNSHFLAFGINADGCTITIPGCTDDTALNFNADANEDDGSCEYACDNGFIPATLYVCTFGNGNEVAIDIVDENGFVVYENSDFGNVEIMNTEICLDPEMCYTVNMYNTVNTGWYGGYYWINVNGVQVSTGYPEDDQNFAAADFSVNGPCGDLVLGCTVEGACNYDSLANWSDNSCTYPGCMDSTALNYDVFAGCDADCVYPEPCDDNQITVFIDMDNFSSEASYVIYDENQNVVDFVINEMQSGENTFYPCLADGCYVLEMQDSFGDGWGFGGGTPGTVIVTTPSGVFEYSFIDGEVAYLGFGVNAEDCQVTVYGCNDTTALNYDANATVDDGSCEYPCGEDFISATLYVCTFSNGNEVAIDIVDEDGNIIYENSDFGNVEVMNTEICLDPTMCYTVNMYNTVNTGWYNGYYWINVNGVQVSTGFPEDDENFATADFSVNGPCGDIIAGCMQISACNYDSLANWDDQSCTYPGCMDSTAYNYNMFAGCDDGSCIYLDPVENDDCADATAISCGETASGMTIGATVDDVVGCVVNNSAPGVWYTIVGTGGNINASTCGQADFDTKISVFGGSCDALECITGNDDTAGCDGFTTTVDFWGEVGVTYYILVHGFATNVGTFDLTVLCSDDLIYGCIDTNACNFDSLANWDDQSCSYPGCIDSTAYNYNMFAGCDDGSCIYLDPVENDACADAIAMDCGDTVSGVTIGATIENLTTCGTSISAPGVWYSIQGTGSNINLSTCGQADFDTKISVFTGSCDSLECIDGNDDTQGCDGFTTTLDFWGENETTYFVLVHGFASNVGTFDLTVLCSDVAPIYGCMDPLAINFDFESNIDDGSCIYGEPDCLAQFAIYEIDVENNMVVIINLASDEDLTYLWDFGDGTTSTEMLPVHFYEEDGTYNVCLTVTNSELECSDTFCMAVTYDGEGYIIDGTNVAFAAEDGFSINIISQATISVDENAIDASSMLIYPNPANDQLTLEINNLEKGNAFYQVIDITGKVVLTDQIQGSVSTISVNSLSNGIYILKLESNNKVSVQRFEVSK